MGFVDSIKSVYSNYVVWKGRASRSEYWWFQLYYLIAIIVTMIIDSFYDSPVLYSIFGLVTFLPALSVTVRRLHDVGHSGWWYWITAVPIVIYGYEGRHHKVFIPIFGFMYAIKLLFTASEEGDNNYGASPLS